MSSKRMFVSFSGGRSSARMVKEVQDKYPNHEVIYLFANTSREHPLTYKFVRQCDEYFGMNLVKLEAVVTPEMDQCTRHKVVSYEDMKTDGSVFESVIQKYGIPNEGYPHCTRELKTNPMYNYLASIGWEPGTYKIAIGIRFDEPKRISETATERNIIYPLVEAGIDKLDVIQFWRSMPFDLEILEREGNCTFCWKKSLTKHILNIQHNPEWYEFPEQMEQKYSMVRPERGPQHFFRDRWSTRRLINLAQALPVQLDLMLNREDEDEGCAKNCEAIV